MVRTWLSTLHSASSLHGIARGVSQVYQHFHAALCYVFASLGIQHTKILVQFAQQQRCLGTSQHLTGRTEFLLGHSLGTCVRCFV